MKYLYESREKSISRSQASLSKTKSAPKAKPNSNNLPSKKNIISMINQSSSMISSSNKGQNSSHNNSVDESGSKMDKKNCMQEYGVDKSKSSNFLKTSNTPSFNHKFIKMTIADSNDKKMSLSELHEHKGNS